MTRSPARPLWDNSPQRTYDESRFSVSYISATRDPVRFREECVLLAQAIAEEARGMPIYVCISGGIDSEVVCRSFVEAEVAFTPVVFRYKKHQRDDLGAIRRFVTSQKLQLKTIPFDEEEFVRNEMKIWAERYPISEPFVAFDMARIDRLDGCVVFGCGDVVLESTNGRVCSYELGSFFQPQLFINDERRTGCYQFFQGSSEIMLAALGDPIMRQWVHLQAAMGFSNSRQFKAYAFKKIWPDLELRRKWTGYERFAALYFEGQKVLNQRLTSNGDRYDLPLDQLLDQLRYQTG